jgi:hypothetical protein
MEGNTAGVNIQGGAPAPEAISAVSNAICDIFVKAAETRMEQETVREAIEALGKIASINGASVTGSNISMKHYHLDDGER